MLKKITAILATFGACAALAQDASASSSEEKTQALYIHPISLISTASIPGMPLWVFLTYEHELNKGQSIAVQPDLWVGSIGTDDPKTDVFSFGLKAFYRKYFNGEKAEGMYVSPALEYTYYSFSEKNTGLSTVTGGGNDLKMTMNQVSVLAYIGYRAKWSGSTLFIDAGLGRGFASVSGDDGVSTGSASGSGLDYGFNFGLGMPF